MLTLLLESVLGGTIGTAVLVLLPWLLIRRVGR